MIFILAIWLLALLNLSCVIGPKVLYWCWPSWIGSGQEWGGLVIQLHNHHPTENISTWLLSMVPWFVRLYLHTMTFSITGSSHTKNGMWGPNSFIAVYLCVLSLVWTDRKSNLHTYVYIANGITMFHMCMNYKCILYTLYNAYICVWVIIR